MRSSAPRWLVLHTAGLHVDPDAIVLVGAKEPLHDPGRPMRSTFSLVSNKDSTVASGRATLSSATRRQRVANAPDAAFPAEGLRAQKLVASEAAVNHTAKWTEAPGSSLRLCAKIQKLQLREQALDLTNTFGLLKRGTTPAAPSAQWEEAGVLEQF